MLEKQADTKFTELDDAMREYHQVFGKELLRSKHLEPLPREPVMSDFYMPCDGQHERELAYAWNRCAFVLL